MPDWKDDLADAVSNKLAKEQQGTEAFNNKQRLIKERAQAIWDGIETAISAASAKINQRAGKQVIAPSPPQLELTQQELIQISFMAESPIRWEILPQNRKENRKESAAQNSGGTPGIGASEQAKNRR